MKRNKVVPVLWLLCFSVLACARTKDRDQPAVSTTRIHGSAPGGDAYIVKYYIDEAFPGSGYETGNLHIVYSDKTEVVEKLRPKEKSTENNIVRNEEGITDPKVAPDRRTAGWTENFDNCGTSYSIPLVLAIYTSGKSILHIQQGQMVWYWTFRDGGKRVAAVWGPTHGPEVGDYQLYDVKTGRMLSEVYGDAKTQSLRPGAPEWARQTEKLYHAQ
jgi:hypothetical protein